MRFGERIEGRNLMGWGGGYWRGERWNNAKCGEHLIIWKINISQVYCSFVCRCVSKCFMFECVCL